MRRFTRCWCTLDVHRRTNEAPASEIYYDHAVLEFPRSGERFRGKANIIGWRAQYPARLDFEPREIRGSGDFWIGEGGLLYDGADPVPFVKILEFRGELVQRETIYTAEPFPAPEWRRPWSEEGTTRETHGNLPARIRGGELTLESRPGYCGPDARP
jgi:hypothetical protein